MDETFQPRHESQEPESQEDILRNFFSHYNTARRADQLGSPDLAIHHYILAADVAIRSKNDALAKRCIKDAQKIIRKQPELMVEHSAALDTLAQEVADLEEEQ